MPADLPPRRSPRARMSLSGTGSGGLQLGGSSMSTKSSASKENKAKDDTMRQTKERLANKKRAASVGGTELESLLKESQNKVMPPSRRNVPGPRKSAIRAVPQVFQSPTGLVPSPKSRRNPSLMSLTAPTEPSIKSKSVPQSSAFAVTRDATQTLGAFGETNQTTTLDLDADRNCATQVIKPKRRVTFSKRQERTEFARDEPTLRLGTLRRDEPATPSSNPNSSSVAMSFSHTDSDSESDSDPDSDDSEEESTIEIPTTSSMVISNSAILDESSDMSLDSSMQQQEQDPTISMQITGSHGRIRKRNSESFDETDSDAEGEADITLEADQSGAMDFTQAVGGAPVVKRRRNSLAEQSAVIDPDQSQASVEHEGEQTEDDDQSQAMDLTMPMGHASSDDTGVSQMSVDMSLDDDFANASSSMAMDITRPVTTVIKTKTLEENGSDDNANFTAISEQSEDDQDETAADMSMPMDMTKAVTGFIQSKSPSDEDDQSMEMDMDTTVQSAMDMTTALGKISPGRSPTRQLFGSNANVSPTKPVTASDRLGSPVRQRSPVRSGSPTKFRQSLRGGVESSAYVHSPARRVGGSLPPPNRPSIGQPPASTLFRQSLVAGVESPGYVRSPARRVPVPMEQSAASTPSKPSTSSNSASNAVSMSARTSSPSPRTKAAAQAFLRQGGRKSLGSNLNGRASAVFKPAPASGEPRFARSSIVAAVLPDRNSNDSFSSIPASEGADVSDGAIRPDIASSPGKLGDSFEVGENGSIRMPLDDFLNHVGVQFHEDMTAYRQRPVPPVKETESEANRSAEDDLGSKGHVGLIRLVKAACGSVPQLEALRDACREIKEQVDDGRERLMEMEQAFYDNPPDFVKEIMCLQNEEEKKEMEAQFKLQKQAARALAVSDYYGWRMDKEFDQEMVQTLQAYQGRLQCDLQIVLAKRDTLRKDLLPILREKHAKLSHDLALARKRQSEIEECDPEELKALYSSIEEQNDVLDLMRSKLRETEEQHQRVLARLEENKEKISLAEEMIAKARAICDQIQGYTRGEAKRLQQEIRNLEKLHLIRMVRVDGDEGTKKKVQLVLDGWLDVRIGIDLAAKGRVESIEMDECVETSNPSMIRRLAVKILQQEFDKAMPENAVQVLRRISKTLIRQRHLLAEIDHLRCRFPLELEASSESDEVSLKASVLLPRQRSKITITAQSDLMSKGAEGATFLADSVQVETIYGSVDAPAMLAQILDYLAADPTIGSLSRACLETIETFDV